MKGEWMLTAILIVFVLSVSFCSAQWEQIIDVADAAPPLIAVEWGQ